MKNRPTYGIIADFSTFCSDCDEWIEVGANIHMIENIGWAHVICPAQPTTPCREICNRCFTEKATNGTCMC